MTERPQHAARTIAAFEVAEGCLVIGGVPLPRLAARVGGTPFFAYSRELITRRVAELRAALPPQIHLSYALKANPMAAVAQHLAGLVDGFDVASSAEMTVALDTPVGPRRVSFAGPGKTARELAQAVAAGVVINAESRTELKAIAAAAERLGATPRVAIRVNPDFELRASGMHMGGGAKAFGIDSEEVPDALAELAALGLDFEGFQIFSGSQNLDAAALCESERNTVELAVSLSAHAPGPVRMLNIGGGFGLPYFPGDEPLDLAAIGANLGELVPVVERALPEARVVVELGRYLVGEAGIYVCRVVDRKVSRGKTFLVTDGGLHHHLAASGNFGQVVRRNFPVAIGSRMAVEPDEAVDVVGCLCTPLDVLAREVSLPRAEVGDYVVVFQSGAYGLTASPTAFLSHPQPVEVLV